MGTRFDRYRMKDGETVLGASYFNPVLQDVDLRIAALEQLQIDWQQAVDEISRFGLDRINAALVPAVEQATELLGQLLEDASGFRESLMREIRPSIIRPDVMEVEYRDGVVTGLIERTAIGERMSQYVYDAEGRVVEASIVFNGVRRIEAYNWQDGAIVSMTATEEPA